MNTRHKMNVESTLAIMQGLQPGATPFVLTRIRALAVDPGRAADELLSIV